jgi:hypothetical protein
MTDPTVCWFGVGRDDLPSARDTLVAEPEGIRERFEWSDSLANVAAGAHRDTIWVLYIFSPAAVFAAVAGAIQLWVGAHDSFWAMVELSAIGSIIALVALASRRDWHGTWLSHRLMAEQLRYMRMGYPLLMFLSPLTSARRFPENLNDSSGKPILDEFEHWILRRSIVAAGAPITVDLAPFHPHNHAQALCKYVLDVMDGQIGYHQKTHHELHIMAHRLHRVTQIAFGLTAVAVLGHFFIHSSWLILFTAALPSLGAAMHGLISSHEMERISGISQATERQLRSIRASLLRVEAGTDTTPYAWLRIRYLAGQAAQVMSQVNEQWQKLLEHRSTGLPA